MSGAPAFKQPPAKPDTEEAVRFDMRYLAKALLKYNASDLHIKVGRPPLYRINGKIIAAKMESITEKQIERLIFSTLTDRQRQDLIQKLQVDFSFFIPDLGRFRANVFFSKGSLSAVIRMIPLNIPVFDELGIPTVLKDLCHRPRGILLVTGATGSGKSTTLAAIIQHINETRPVHIITIEDPIEFVYRDQKATITQREVGSDIHSFKDGLYAGLRQDPDVMVIGELRDPITIQTALTAAETGHLVVSTLHTKDAKSTIERMVEVFPAEAMNQIRIQLASTLVGVVSQTLVVRRDGLGRVPACEVLINSPAIENYILKNEINKIPEAMSNSSNYYKMQTLNQDLERLVASGVISKEEAMKVSPSPDDLKLRLAGVSREEGYEILSVPPSKR